MNRPFSAQAAAAHTAVWPAFFAALLALGLLVAFHQVVQGAVDQAKLRRQAAALHADADWRCRNAPNLVRRIVLPVVGSTANGPDDCQESK